MKRKMAHKSNGPRFDLNSDENRREYLRTRGYTNEWIDKQVDIVRSVFPPHEHEQEVARHRALVGAWVREQEAA